VVELRDFVIHIHARDYCDACCQNVYSVARIFVIVVMDMKWIFLCNNEKIYSFYFFIILIMHRIFKQQGWSKIKGNTIEDN
jgi:hypothetical protein